MESSTDLDGSSKFDNQASNSEKINEQGQVCPSPQQHKEEGKAYTCGGTTSIIFIMEPDAGRLPPHSWKPSSQEAGNHRFSKAVESACMT